MDSPTEPKDIKTNPTFYEKQEDSRKFILFPDSPDIFRFPSQDELPAQSEVRPFSHGIPSTEVPPGFTRQRAQFSQETPAGNYQMSYYGSSLFSSSPPDPISRNSYKVGNTSSDTSSPDTSPEKPEIKLRKSHQANLKCRRRLFNLTEEEVTLVSSPSKISEQDQAKPVVILPRPKRNRNRKKNQTDRLNVLSSLLEMSGRSVEKQFRCYLDLGCGNGEIFSTNMAFLDPRLGYCADLHNNHLPGFIKVVDNKIPLPNKSVDLITCHVAIHHFTHPELMINEMKRVIMPGGYLFIREHDVSREEETYVTAYLNLLHMMELIRHRRPITKSIQSTFHRKYWSRYDMNQSLSSVGFEEIGFQSYVKHSNPQRIYHALYTFCPKPTSNEDRETIRISKTVQYSVDRNNLVVWLRTNAKKISKSERRWLDGYDRTYYRWFSDTIRKKLGLDARRLDRMIHRSIDDLDFFQQIFDIIHPNFDYSHQVNYSSAFAESLGSTRKIVGRPRSRSSPDNKNEITSPKTRRQNKMGKELRPPAGYNKVISDNGQRDTGGYRENKKNDNQWKIQSNRGRRKRGYRRTRSNRQFGFYSKYSHGKNEYHSRHGH